MSGRGTPASKRVVVLLGLGIVAIGLAACGYPDAEATIPVGDATAITAMSSTTTTSTVVPTVTTLNPLLMSCVDYVQFKAYAGDAFWQQVWLDLDESKDALGAWCDDFSEGDWPALPR